MQSLSPYSLDCARTWAPLENSVTKKIKVDHHYKILIHSLCGSKKKRDFNQDDDENHSRKPTLSFSNLERIELILSVKSV